MTDQEDYKQEAIDTLNGAFENIDIGENNSKNAMPTSNEAIVVVITLLACTKVISLGFFLIASALNSIAYEIKRKN